MSGRASRLRRGQIPGAPPVVVPTAFRYRLQIMSWATTPSRRGPGQEPQQRFVEAGDRADQHLQRHLKLDALGFRRLRAQATIAPPEDRAIVNSLRFCGTPEGGT